MKLTNLLLWIIITWALLGILHTHFSLELVSQSELNTMRKELKKLKIGLHYLGISPEGRRFKVYF